MLIDKIGKRGFIISLSSLILISGYTASMLMPECNQCYNEVVPLVILGLGFSIYCSAIWGSIPYVVRPSSVGTAFGIATAIQDVGLVITPTIVGKIKDKTAAIDHGYFYTMAFFILITSIGLILNLILYYIDIYHNH